MVSSIIYDKYKPSLKISEESTRLIQLYCDKTFTQFPITKHELQPIIQHMERIWLLTPKEVQTLKEDNEII